MLLTADLLKPLAATWLIADSGLKHGISKLDGPP